MAKQQAESGKPKKKVQTGPGRLIGRIVLYGVLAVLLVLGLMEYRTKSAAQATSAAWSKASNQLPEHEEFRQSQLAGYVKGRPTTRERDASKLDGQPVASIMTYTWKGVFRRYDVHVGLGLGEDRPVEAVVGPGVKDPLTGE